jgi:DNA-binding XRE family transcriptional regulator
MAKRIDTRKRIYREGLIERVKMARKASGLPTQAVAAAIGIAHRRYLSYERNTQMRPWFWQRFCSVTGADIGFLICEHRRRYALKR